MAWERWAKIAPRNLARYANGEVTSVIVGDITLTDASGAPATRFDLRAQDPKRLVECVYDHLRIRDIEYDREPVDFREGMQQVRSPVEVLGVNRRGRGTCLDLSLVFAALCLEAGLLPQVVLLDDHALVVVDVATDADDRDARRRQKLYDGGVLADPARLAAMVDQASHVAVECTGFAVSQTLDGRDSAGQLSYADAEAAARDRLDAGDVRAVLDMATLHAGGLEAFPLPLDRQSIEVLATAQNVGRLIGNVAAVKDQLIAKPERTAMTQLAQALDEIFRTWMVVEAATNSFLARALSLQALTGDTTELIELTGYTLEGDIAQGRGHCSRITSLYHDSIRSWFADVLSEDALADMDRTFDAFHEMDGDAFRHMEMLGRRLSEEAQEVVDLLGRDEHQEARTRIATAAREIGPLRDQIGRTMQTLTDLKLEILAAAEQAPA